MSDLRILKAVILGLDSILTKVEDIIPYLGVLLARRKIIIKNPIFERSVKEHWGLPIYELLATLFEVQAISRAVSEEESEIIDEEWKIVNAFFPLNLTQDAQMVLDWLFEADILVVIHTSRQKESVINFLKHHGILEKVSILSTLDDNDFSAPDPRSFDFALEELAKNGIKKEECVFVGHSASHAWAGVGAGIETVIVLSWENSHAEILEAGVGHQNCIESLAMLIQWIGDNFGYINNR